MKKVILLFSLSLFLFNCGDGNSSGEEKTIQKKELKEVVIERYSEGDKKIVGFYDGEGSNEVIVKRVHYYENGQLKKVESSVDYILNGDYKEWSEDGKLIKHLIYKDDEVIKTIK